MAPHTSPIQPSTAIRSKRRRQGGQAALETALSMTILFMTIVGTIDFGLMAFVYNQLAYLAQEGARYASVRGSSLPTASQATTSSISTYVTGLAVALPQPLTITTTWENNANTPGNWVRVQVQHPLTLIGPWMPTGSQNLGATAQITVVR